MSTQKRFFSGMLLLTFSNIVIKAVGLLFKIPLTNLIGETGMGYFNSAYTIYAWFYMLTTAGLSVAVSMMVSEYRARANAKQIKIVLRTVLLLFFAIGLVGTLIMVIGADKLAGFIRAPEAAVCIAAIAPSLFFSCLASALRGYFQGYQIMFPTAVSQVMEACGKLFIGISIAKYTLSLGMDISEVAACALLGIFVGIAAGFLFLCGTKFFFNDKKYDAEYSRLDGEEENLLPTHKIASRLIKLAVPITISSSVMSLTNIFDTLVMTDRLMAFGYSNADAIKIYGNYTSLAVPMFNLPPVLIYAITYSVVPLITAAVTRREYDEAKKYMHSSIKLTSLIAMPCAVGLTVLSYQILDLFFARELVDNGASMLTVLAPSVFFVCMLAITNAILQAYGYEKKPISSMLAGSAVKLVSSYLLIPVLGKYGSPVGTFLCYATIVVMNMYFVAKYTSVVPSMLNVYVKPLVAGALCGIVAIATSHVLVDITGNTVATVAAIGAAAIVYLASVLVMKCLDKDDIMILPKGEKIYSVFKRLRVVK
ncbi:MAG: polysaccharide biosynthesis protein [Clostridia bacterium]|nr:polysaccharide biosynthesis protein [Clostridia bacterium]